MWFKKPGLLWLLSILSICVHAQRGTNWFFGDKAGIKFTATGVVNQPASNITTDEGCSSISDTAGNLLFYSNGITVYNRLHVPMTNGTGLMGHSSSSQSSIVIPMPGSDSLYYLFTATEYPGQYTYNVIDMSLNGGLGDVSEKNRPLGSQAGSERITIIQHANKKDFWIVTNPGQTDVIHAYLLTSAGLQTTPVTTATGYIPETPVGMLKGSPDGAMLVQTVSAPQQVGKTRLYHFNTGTGKVSDPIDIPFSQGYGCCFSPDSKRLYLNNGFPGIQGSLVQYTVKNYDAIAIATSRYDIPVAAPKWLGDLSVGPDSVMYLARFNQHRLSAIKQPNDSGVACRFIDTAIILNGVSKWGLPNFYNNINAPPGIELSIERLSCLRYKFSFNTNYQGTGTYRWDFGDGSFSVDSAAIHTFVRNTTDSFLVTYQFTSSDGSVNIQLQQWLVLPRRPKAGFTADATGCIGKPVMFTNTSTSNGGPVYSWNFGDNTTSANASPVKQYPDTGTYIVRLSLVDSIGCLSDTASLPVTVNKKAFAGFDIAAPYCVGSLQITDTSSAWNTIVTEWKYFTGPTNTIITSPVPLQVLRIDTPGTYNIRLVVNTNAGCVSDTAAKTVTVYPRPHAGFIIPRNCVTDVSSFTDTSSVDVPSYIDQWRWQFGEPSSASNTSTLQHPTHQYGSAGNYTVQLVVASDRGCRDTATQIFTVNGAVPKAALSFIQDPVCSADSAALVNTSSVNFGKLVNLQIDWSNGVTTDPDPLPGKTYKNLYAAFSTPASIIQPIRLTVQSGISCISILDTFITIKAKPKVQLQPFAAICANASPLVLAGGSETTGSPGAGSYTGTAVRYDTASAKYLFIPAVIRNTSAIVGYRFITPGGCGDSAFQTINLLPVPKVNAGYPQVILYGDQVTLNGSASGTGLTYHWAPAGWLNDATIPRPIANPPRDTIYTLTVTTADNCSDSASVSVRVLQPVIVPNAFSPNNDRVNDTWVITNLNMYAKPSVQVFNRWGQLLYQNFGYQKAWDGTFNGKPLPTGTYYYIVSPGNGSRPVTGWLQLLR